MIIKQIISCGLLIFVIGLTSSPYLAAADDYSEIEFETLLGRANIRQGVNFVVENENGDLLVGGSVLDDTVPSYWGWVSRVNARGHVIWHKEFGKKAIDSDFLGAITNKTNEILLIGFVNGRTSGFLEKATGWIVRLRGNGEVISEKTVQISTATRLIDVKALPSNELLVLGTIRGTDHTSMVLLKLNAKGDVIWKKVIPEFVTNASIFIGTDGSWFLGGTVGGLDGSSSVSISRFDHDGNLQWNSRVGRDEEFVTIQQVDSENLIIMTNAISRKYVTKFVISQNGKILSKRLLENNLCHINDAYLSEPNKVIFAGKSCNKTTDGVWITEFDKDGELTSSRTLIINGIAIRKIAKRQEGGLIVVGSQAGTGNTYIMNISIRSDHNLGQKSR